jgi:hypothetical protein
MQRRYQTVGSIEQRLTELGCSPEQIQRHTQALRSQRSRRNDRQENGSRPAQGGKGRAKRKEGSMQGAASKPRPSAAGEGMGSGLTKRGIDGEGQRSVDCVDTRSS